MSVKANVLAIKALKPRTRDYETAIKEHKGLVVCTYPSGAKSFVFRYRQDGDLRRIKLPAASLEDAIDEWRTQRKLLDVGKDPLAAVLTKRAKAQSQRQDARRAPTFEELASEYVSLYARKKKRSWRDDELMLAAVARELGAIKAADVTRRDMVVLLDKIAKRAPIYANRVLAVVRKMYNFGIDRDVLATSPCARLKPPGATVRRDRVLSDAELIAFWTNLPNSGMPLANQAVLRLQLLTGARVGEIVGATWNEVDLKKGEWLLPATRTKNGRGHFVPLSPLTVSLFRTQARDDLGGDDSAAIFPAPGVAGHLRVDAVVHELAHSLPRLGLSGVRSHDLRRTCATKLAQLGTSRTVIEAILNHVDRSVGAIYDRHSYAAEKRNALEAWAKYLLKLVHSDADKNVVPMKRAARHVT